jgi:hypothetical protein
MDDLCEANGSFAIRLLKILGEEDKSQNVFFCPLSISSALAMVFMGAKGNTASQMSQVCTSVRKEVQRWVSLLIPSTFSPLVKARGQKEGHRGDANMGRKANPAGWIISNVYGRHQVIKLFL